MEFNKDLFEQLLIAVKQFNNLPKIIFYEHLKTTKRYLEIKFGKSVDDDQTKLIAALTASMAINELKILTN